MYKFFVSTNQIHNQYIKILGGDVKHISNVLRLHTSDRIIICNKDTSQSFVTEIIKIDKECIDCKIIEQITESKETNINVDVFQGLPKFDKMELIIQKATELGARAIYPVAFERCIVKLSGDSEKKKIERWQKISEVAAKQSKRDIIPLVKSVINVEEICQNIENYDIILLAYENEENNSIKYELQKLDKNKELSIGIIIGPEGGITNKEAEKLEKAGIKSVSLGKRILRTETASLAILSDIIYEFEL